MNVKQGCVAVGIRLISVRKFLIFFENFVTSQQNERIQKSITQINSKYLYLIKFFYLFEVWSNKFHEIKKQLLFEINNNVLIQMIYKNWAMIF